MYCFAVFVTEFSLGWFEVFCFTTFNLDTGASFRTVAVKKLTFDKGEILEGHAWSSDGQVFAVAGCKIYLFQVR